jgi:phage terminase Nu1 subunit (DNA packaging protein)
MDLNIPVSGRQFAKMVGQSEGAVRKAVERGSIVKGYTADKKLIPLIASNEWGKPILADFLDAENLRDTTAGIKIKKLAPVKKSPALKKQKKEPQTADEVVAELMDDPLPHLSDDEINEDVDQDLDDKILKPEAERITAILKAKILQLALKEKQGKLVPIDKVNSVLFGYGQEIRNTFEALPAQVIDRIRACDNRHEALRVLNDAIFDALNLLADINSREI